jgi:hypothetical protein
VEVVLKRPTGFSYSGEVLIYRKGQNSPFYEHVVKNYFQLPKGTYNFKEPKGIPQKIRLKKYKVKLPKRERNYKVKLPTISKGMNPDKASIYKGLNWVLFDKDFYNKTTFCERAFIYCHEIGHYRYKTEWKCDVFAAWCLLKLGFNPSQIAQASVNTLTRNYERKRKLLNYLKNA